MQEHRNHVAAKLEGSPSFPQITNRSIPRRNSPLLANLLATRSPCLPPWYAARSQSQKTPASGTPRPNCADSNLICEGRLPNPWKRFIIEIAISCDMSHTFGQRMNPHPKQKRERFQQLTQNPKVKIGKVFAADLRKSKIHPTVKKLTAWRKANRLSQPKAVAVLGQYYFHITFASLRSWEEGRRSPNPHTAGILEKFLSDHPTVESPKKLKQP